MDIVALCARVLLAAVLGVSGVAKLRDRDGSRQAVADFGLPGPLVAPIAAVVAPLELLCALGLLAGGAAAFAAGLASAGLLLSFTVAIVVNLLRGRRPDCHCFGRLAHRPVSWWSVGRNAGFLALAAAVVAAGPAQPWGLATLRDRPGSELAVGAAVAAAVLAFGAAAVVGAHLVRGYGALLLRVERLEAELAAAHGHRTAPDLELAALDGPPRRVSELVVERPAIVVFASTSCAPCAELAPEIAGWAARAHAGVAVVVAGPPDQAREKFAGDDVTVLLDGGVAQQEFAVDATPAAVVVDPDRRVVGGPAYGADAIRALVAPYLPASTGLDLGRRPIAPGDDAPAVELLDESGEPVELTAAVGDGVVLFWDPACGFANRIVDDVVAWEESADRRLVLATRGDPTAVRASGLRAPLLRDPDFAAGRAYGAPGTPSAIALSDGRVASDLAVGGPDVLELLRAPVPAVPAEPTGGSGEV